MDIFPFPNMTSFSASRLWVDWSLGASRLWVDWFLGISCPFRLFSPAVFSHSPAAKSLQSCLTLCDPMDGSPPGSAVPGILQARILEWGAVAFSSAWKWKGKVKSLSRVRLLATPWTAAYQAPPSMGFSRQEYQSGVPLPSVVTLPICLQFLLTSFLLLKPPLLLLQMTAMCLKSEPWLWAFQSALCW